MHDMNDVGCVVCMSYKSASQRVEHERRRPGQQHLRCHRATGAAEPEYVSTHDGADNPATDHKPYTIDQVQLRAGQGCLLLWRQLRRRTGKALDAGPNNDNQEGRTGHEGHCNHPPEAKHADHRHDQARDCGPTPIWQALEQVFQALAGNCRLDAKPSHEAECNHETQHRRPSTAETRPASKHARCQPFPAADCAKQCTDCSKDTCSYQSCPNCLIQLQSMAKLRSDQNSANTTTQREVLQ
mmetsp:Transcript_22994/g.47731  ORF Transcript_22994/g.47731 Transcript_22994/m.47731 type:complete len:241 (+) Transcript_22994:536-1258(+)